jgi:hypothetical protein
MGSKFSLVEFKDTIEQFILSDTLDFADKNTEKKFKEFVIAAA